MRNWLTLAICIALAPCAAPPARAAAAAPFELRPAREAALLAADALLGAAALAVHAAGPFDQAALDRLDPAAVNRFDRAATRRWSPAAADASDALVATLLLAPAALAACGGCDDARATPLALCAETVLLTGTVTELLKRSVSRTRPYAYNADPAIPPADRLAIDARRSFPSSHAAHAFAAAVLLGRLNDAYNPDSPARPWVWAASLAAATTTATLRCTAGRHFPTDVLAGAALGAAAGWAIPELHRPRPAHRLTLDLDQGLALTLRF